MGLRKFITILLLAFISWSALANTDLWQFPFAEDNTPTLKVGWYPGSFDPPHNGHLNIIERAVSDLDLDTIYVTVKGLTEKEKLYKASIEERVRLVKAMVKGRFPHVNVIVSVEPIRGKRHLIKGLIGHHGQNNVHAIFGSDTLQLNWGRIGDIQGFNYVLMSRPGYEADTTGVDKSRLFFVDGGPGVYSSSKVREDILKTGGSSLLGDEVNFEVARSRLYSASSIKQHDYYVAKRFYINQRMKRKFPEIQMPKKALIPQHLQSEAAYDDLIIRQILHGNPSLNFEKQRKIYEFYQTLLSTDNLLNYRAQHAKALRSRHYQNHNRCFGGLHRLIKMQKMQAKAFRKVRK